MTTDIRKTFKYKIARLLHFIYTPSNFLSQLNSEKFSMAFALYSFWGLGVLNLSLVFGVVPILIFILYYVIPMGVLVFWWCLTMVILHIGLARSLLFGFNLDHLKCGWEVLSKSVLLSDVQPHLVIDYIEFYNMYGGADQYDIFNRYKDNIEKAIGHNMFGIYGNGENQRLYYLFDEDLEKIKKVKLWPEFGI